MYVAVYSVSWNQSSGAILLLLLLVASLTGSRHDSHVTVRRLGRQVVAAASSSRDRESRLQPLQQQQRHDKNNQVCYHVILSFAGTKFYGCRETEMK